MFPADIIPSTYCEARKEAEAHRAAVAQRMAAAAAANNANKDESKIAQPAPQRPAGPSRTFSSAFFGFFPSASASIANSQASSAQNSPSATPMPSPSLNGPKNSWFAPRPIPKATDMDIAVSFLHHCSSQTIILTNFQCLPPAWS